MTVNFVFATTSNARARRRRPATAQWGMATLALCALLSSVQTSAAQERGVCGPAHGKLVMEPPASGLCAAGEPSQINGQGPWLWSCTLPGQLPKTRANCSAPTSTSRATPIPDSRFEKYVKFYGDQRNRGLYATQARVDDTIAKTEQPFFMAGFFRPEDHPSWGMLASVQSDNRAFGTFAFSTTTGQTIDLFEWRNGPWRTLARSPGLISRGLSSRNPASFVLNRWQFAAAFIKDQCTAQIFLEGVWGTSLAECVPWPTGLSSTTFGSYYDITKQQNDSHVFNGGLRDWAVVSGIPTTPELMRMRNGEDPRAIWGAARVWGFWNFTADPATGAKEPDLTGHGHDLTYIGAGLQDPRKPELVVLGRADRKD